MFLDEITVIDHAYVDVTGQVKGGSFEASFIVSGKVDDHESVVVDFSTIKSDIKHFIDHHDKYNNLNGLDHKLWVLEYSYRSLIHSNVDDTITITTPTFTATLPADAIKVMNDVSEYNISNIEAYLEVFLGKKLKEKYPGINISIKCHLSEKPIFYDDEIKEYVMFQYVHGLKDSTSLPCMNLLHGHLSYIQCSQLKDLDLVARIKADMDNCIFIMKENILAEDEETLTIGYTTEARGKFECKFKKKYYKLIVLETETTIEYLANYIKDKYNITETLFVSEGLNKGAVL
jgi:6-pyruvoyl-tetrahydropterin synthase